MSRRAAVLALATALFSSAALPAGATTGGYDLPEAGVYLEGIGVDHRARAVYVSATNRDGTIYLSLIHISEPTRPY